MKSGSTPPEELRRRIAGWRAAEDRERRLRRVGPVLAPAAALVAAAELCELAGAKLNEVDSVREREVLEARAAWRLLRERMGWRPNARSRA